MSDEKFEDFLRNAAKTYNTPPARTPREDMWNAIQAKRSAGPRVVYGGGAANISSGEKRFGSKVWWAAAAGIVLVASGIGIGRLTAPVAPTVATSPSVVVRPEPTASNDPARAELQSDATRGPADARATQTPFTAKTSQGEVSHRGATEVVDSSGSLGPRPISIDRAETSSSVSRGIAPTLAYDMSEVNHLPAAE